MKYIASSFESFALGLCAGLLYMLLQVKTAEWARTSQDNQTAPLIPRAYRSLLLLRLSVTVLLMIIISKTCIPDTQWLLIGFLSCVVLQTARIIWGVSWI